MQQYRNATVYRRITPPAGVLGPALAALGLLLVVTAPVRPQEQPQERPDRWEAAAELTFTDTRGNQDMSLLTTGFTLKHRQTEVYALEFKIQARYGSSDGERVAESYRGSVDFGITPASRWGPFLYSTAEHDPFKRLHVRVTSGGGARFVLIPRGPSSEATLSLAMLHSYEEQSNADSERIINRNARWSVQLNGRHKISEGITLNHTAQYRPVHDRLDDYLLNLETALRILVTRRIALTMTHEFDRDATPAPDVRPNDRLLRAGLLVQL